MEDWVTIQNLKRHNPQIGTCDIAKLVGCSRNMVNSALKREQYTGYNRTETVNLDIEPIEQFIRDSIINKKLQGSRVLVDIRLKDEKRYFTIRIGII